MDDPANSGPLRYFRLLPDPRAANARHRLIDILLIALCAMICATDGWDDIEDFAGTVEHATVVEEDMRFNLPVSLRVLAGSSAD